MGDLTGRLKEIIYSYKHLGEKIVSETGAHLIAKAPHKGSEAWLFALYPGLANDEISQLENSINIEFNEDYKDFLRQINGFHFLVNVFSMDGLRRNYKRTGDSIWQPYDIITPNTIERPKNSPPHYLYIGGYNWDGSSLCMDTKTDKVYRCKRWTSEILNTWENLEDMLSSEPQRLIKLFDDSGKKIDPERPTIPNM